MESIELTMVELISNYYLDTDGGINYVGDPLGPTTRLFFFFSFLFSFFSPPPPFSFNSFLHANVVKCRFYVRV